MLGLADRGRGLELFERLMRGAIAEALAEFRSQYDSGADPLAVMQDMTQICHEVTRVKVSGGTTHAGAPESEARRVGELGAKLTVPQLARTWQLLLKALAEVQSAPDGAAAVEMAMIRIAFAAELPPTEQLLRTVGSAPPAAPRGVGAVSAPPAPPPMRMSATRNESVPAQAEPSASLAPVVARVPLLELRNFVEVVDLAREKREARLVYALEHWVHLVAFERGRLELRLNPAAPATFPGELSDRLAKWTGERWIVSVSSAEGEATLAEQAQAEEQVRRASAAQDPLLKAAMAMFPGARIVAVRDRDALSEPEGNGERE